MSLSNLGKLKFLLKTNVSKQFFNSLCANVKWNEREKQLFDVLVKLNAADLEFNAENIWNQCKDKRILAYYMRIIDSFDRADLEAKVNFSIRLKAET